MIEHSCLHQIPPNQIFSGGWGCVVKEVLTREISKIWLLIWETHINASYRWPRSTGGRVCPGLTYCSKKYFLPFWERVSGVRGRSEFVCSGYSFYFYL